MHNKKYIVYIKDSLIVQNLLSDTKLLTYAVLAFKVLQNLNI